MMMMMMMTVTGLRELPYWSGYSKCRLLLHAVVTSKYFDLCIAGVIGLNVITMALEFYLMPAVGRRHRPHTHTYAHTQTERENIALQCRELDKTV